MCGWFGQMNTEKQRMISAGSEAVSLYRKDCPIFEYLSVIYNEIIAPPTFLSLRGCRIPMMTSIDTEIPLAQHHGYQPFPSVAYWHTNLDCRCLLAGQPATSQP